MKKEWKRQTKIASAMTTNAAPRFGAAFLSSCNFQAGYHV